MAKKHKAILQKFDSVLWYFHITVPEEIARPFIKGRDRRVICTLQGKESFPCALMNLGSGGFFININKAIRLKLKLKEGDEVTYSLEKDKSEFGLPMPEEMEEMLKQDPEGEKIFRTLTPGKIRTLLYIVSSTKNTDSRIRKAFCILEHLKATNGKLNYRQLNELFKNYR